MEKIKKFWNAVSYEVVIAAGLIVWFLTGRALDLQGWSSAWNAMDYSMGTGSRLLIGSIYRLFYGEYLDYTVAYKYVAVGTMLTILVLAIVLGRMIRLAVTKNDQIRHAVFGAVALYLVAPFSIAYVWNDQNLGRLDVYMLLVALLPLFTGFCPAGCMQICFHLPDRFSHLFGQAIKIFTLTFDIMPQVLQQAHTQGNGSCQQNGNKKSQSGKQQIRRMIKILLIHNSFYGNSFPLMQKGTGRSQHTDPFLIG